MKRLLAVLAFAASSLGAQSLPLLPRATPTGAAGLRLADSSLIACMDSANTLNRACTFRSVQQRLSFKAFDSLVTTSVRLPGTLNLTGGTVSGTPTWSSKQTFAAGQVVDTAVKVRGLLVDTATLAKNLTGSPAITVSSCTGCGGGVVVRDTVKLVTFDSVKATRFTATDSIKFGGTTSSIRGGTGNMTLQPGTGVSRTLTITPTDAGGVARTALVAIDSQVQFPAGRAGKPVLALSSDPTSGLFFLGSSTLGVSTAGTNWTLFDAAGGGTGTLGRARTRIFAGTGQGSATDPTFSWSGFVSSGMFLAPGGNDTVAFSNNGTRSLSIAGGAATTLIGGTGSMTVQAGIGASRTMTLATTTSGSTAKNVLVLGADSSATFLGDIKSPTSLRFVANGTTTRSGNNTLDSVFIQTVMRGPARLAFSPTTSTAANYISFQNSGTVYVGQESTTGSSFSAPNSALVIGTTSSRPVWIAPDLGASSALVLWAQRDTAKKTWVFGDSLLLKTAPATGAGDVSLCITTTSVVTSGAACGTSSAKVKTGFASIRSPLVKTMALQPTAYSYIPGMYGARREYGLVADSAAKVDSLLVFRAQADQKLPNGQTIKKGDALNVNDRAVLALAIASIQELTRQNERQQKTLDSLVTALRKPGRELLDSLSFNYQAEMSHANIAVTVTPDGSVIYAPGTTLDSLKPVFRALATPKKP